MASSKRPGNARVLGLLLVGCVVAIALLATGMGTGFGLGAWINKKSKGKTDGTGAIQLPDAPLPPPPILADWPTDAKPAVTLIVTGEMYGYLRPCGCSLGQYGGLPRRGGVFAYLKKRLGDNLVPVDMGDLVKEKDPSQFEELRYRIALEAFRKLGYRCVGIGMFDLRRLMLQNLLAQIGQDDANKEESVKYLLGGVSLTEKDYQIIVDQMAKPVQLIKRNGRKIAVAWLMDDAEQMQELKGNPIDQAVPALLKLADAEKPDIKVLLAHVSFAKAQAIAEKHPGFDVIVSRNDGDDSATSFAKRVGKTLVATVGRKGKSVGVLGLFPDDEMRLRFAVLPVEDRPEFPNDPEQDKLYVQFVSEIQKAKWVEKSSRIEPPNGDKYVGAEACGKCHKKAFEKWSTTRHSHAFESLAESNVPGKQFVPAGQQYNPECVSCHTTAFKYTGGFVTKEKTPKFLGNQCENCHGPGKKHSDDPKNPEYLAKVRLVQSQVEQRCRECHDLDNSPKFDFAKAWPQIAHPWRD